jgi:hypothetical protein
MARWELPSARLIIVLWTQHARTNHYLAPAVVSHASSCDQQSVL